MVLAVIVSFATAGFAVGLLGLALAYALCALVALGWVVVCRRLVGGQTGDLIGALQALLEIAALTAFMVFV
jgi:adenosylcobinamide-GDP ribazoletransferase